MSKPKVFLATNPFVNGLLRACFDGPDAEVVGELPGSEPVPAHREPGEHWRVQLESRVKQLADAHRPPDIVFLPSAGADAVRLSHRLLDVCPNLVVYFTPVADPTEAAGLVCDRRSTAVREVTVRSLDDVREVLRWAGPGNGRPETGTHS